MMRVREKGIWGMRAFVYENVDVYMFACICMHAIAFIFILCMKKNKNVVIHIRNSMFLFSFVNLVS